MSRGGGSFLKISHLICEILQVAKSKCMCVIKFDMTNHPSEKLLIISLGTALNSQLTKGMVQLDKILLFSDKTFVHLLFRCQKKM